MKNNNSVPRCCGACSEGLGGRGGGSQWSGEMACPSGRKGDGIPCNGCQCGTGWQSQQAEILVCFKTSRKGRVKVYIMQEIKEH